MTINFSIETTHSGDTTATKRTKWIKKGLKSIDGRK